MILIGLGSNLTTQEYVSSKDVLEAAFEAFSKYNISILKRSKFYETEPIPKSDQPWFINAVVSVKTGHNALDLLNILHEIEQHMGRVRRDKWEARVIDLDLLCYDDEIYPSPAEWQIASKNPLQDKPVIPHARLHERNFVLIPIIDISSDWIHPVLNKNVLNLLKDSQSDEIVRVL